jgi:DeoR/GlpR family transcriptional regulator of sugar metabolism
MKHILYPQERHRQIVAYLEQIGRVSVEELSRRFGISRVTIRSDLEILANQNLLVRTHGGAILTARSESELSFKTRQRIHTAEKELIAAAAANLIKDNDTIVLDASTTALHIAVQIRSHKNLTVFTNSLPVAMELLDAPGVNVFVPAGFLRKESASLVGMSCLETLKDYNLHKAFFSAKGFTLAEGLTEVSEPEAAVKREILTKSRDLIAVVDSSKLGRASFASFAPLERMAIFITDQNASPEIVESIRAAGVIVTIV